MFPESSAHGNHTAAAAFCPDVTRRFDSERPPADKALVGPHKSGALYRVSCSVRVSGSGILETLGGNPGIPSHSKFQAALFLTTSGAERCVRPWNLDHVRHRTPAIIHCLGLGEISSKPWLFTTYDTVYSTKFLVFLYMLPSNRKIMNTPVMNKGQPLKKATERDTKNWRLVVLNILI